MKRLVDGFVVEMGARARTEDEDLVIGMAFSSEEPAERWWGTEILDHGEGSIRLGRLNDGAPLLYNHDSRDMRGVHEPGTMKIGKADNANREVEIEVAFVPRPEDIDKSLTTYVVWLKPSTGAGDWMNMGQLSVNDDRKGKIRFVTPHPSFVVEVAAEANPTVTNPSQAVVLEGRSD